MTRTQAWLAIGTLACAVCVMFGAAQPAGQPGGQPVDGSPDMRRSAWFVELDARIDGGLDDRFAALDPARPADYLDLAEFIASESASRSARANARTLAGLAFVLGQRVEATDESGEAGSRVSASAALFLAEMAQAGSDRAWFRGVARVLEPRLESRDWTRPRRHVETPPGAEDAATALGLVRAGRGTEAARLLQRPEIRELIERYDRVLLGEGGGGDVLEMLDRETRVWPCPECANRRVVPGRRAGSDERFTACGTCRANPGPRLSNQMLIGHLSLEARLLSGVQRSWAAQIAADLAAPLRDPDPADVVRRLQFDPARARWADGRWVP